MKRLEDSFIIVCSIVRNAAKGLKKNIPIIDQLCERAKDYRIVIYENDSIDDTKDLLRQWQVKDTTKIHISINDNDSLPTIPSSKSVSTNPFFCKMRIEKMARLRNHYMEYVDNCKWNGDYLIVVDLDVAELNYEGVLTSFNQNKIEWDAVTAWGYSISPKLRKRYHDTYALAELGDDKNPQTEKKIRVLADKYGKVTSTDDWTRVFSAFGGLAIYRYEAIEGLRYSTIPNNDEKVEVRCEHYSIYKQMQEQGVSNVFINPAMTLKYQDLSFSIVWKSTIRILTGIYQKSN